VPGRRDRPPELSLDWHGRWDGGPLAPSRLHCLAPAPAPSDASQADEHRLIYADNLAAMLGLLERHEGRIDLIYADPPFLTGRSYPARVGTGEDSRQPTTWKTEHGFGDRWAGLPDYLSMLEPRLLAMYHLLAPTGTLYLHLDWHAAPYVRVLLDQIFGRAALLNEVIWTYHGPSPVRRAFNRKHDTLLIYARSPRYYFDSSAVRVPYDPTTVRTFRASRRAGFGKLPDLERGKVPEDWWYFPVVARLHAERTGYPTQKPEALLERIVLASSPPDGVVLDPFCGSGTTLAVASRTGRPSIGIDDSALAFWTAYRRLMLLPAPPRVSLWHAPPLPAGPSPEAEIVTEGGEAHLDLVGLRGSDAFPAEIALWEASWELPAGAAPARITRPRRWRAAELPLRMSGIPADVRQVRVRVVTARGTSGECVARDRRGR
jgi:DNA modification methylase